MSSPISRYLVTYDIENDRVRGRVVTLLEGTGWRVQKSVFECMVDGDGLERLTRGLTRELERGPGGNVRVYRLCASCLEVSFGLGEVAAGSGAEPWIVVLPAVGRPASGRGPGGPTEVPAVPALARPREPAVSQEPC